jgi:uncharacterized protein YfeS
MKFELTVSPSGNPVFKFKKSKSESYAALNFVNLVILWVSKDNLQSTEICWELWLDATKSKGKIEALTELEYGILPKGYLEDSAAIPLRVGEFYCLGGFDPVIQKISEREYKVLDGAEFDNLMGKPQRHPEIKQSVTDNYSSPIHPSKSLSHPTAVQLMTDDFFWDASDNDSPFGSDDGWQVMMDFINHIEKGSLVKIVEFLSDEFDRLALCSYQFWLSQKNEPFGFELEDGNRIVIAATFAQLMMMGATTADLREAFQHAIKLSYLLNDFRKKYLDRLRKMEDIIRQAPDLS